MDPKITNITTNNDVLEFTLSDIDVSLANSIRRVILSEIPTNVFRTETHEENKCNIEINTTRLHNEIIKQRLSCIPIYMDLDELDILPDNYIMTLDVKNDTPSTIYVTSGDFKIINKTTSTPLKEAEIHRIFPKDPITQDYIDLVRLRPQISDTIPGEHLKLTAEFSICTAQTNSMFNVVSKCSYGNTIDPTKAKQKWEAKAKELSKDDDIEFHKKNFYLLDAQRCFVENSFDFVIQSLGMYDNQKIVKKAVEILYEKFETMKQAVASKLVTILHSNTTMENCFDIKLENEDYTMGPVLRYILYMKYYDKNKVLNFCGFKKDHPHDNHSILRLALKESGDNSKIQALLEDACDEAIFVYKKLYNML